MERDTSGAPSASKTAAGVALMRAAHMVLDAEPRLLVDPISASLLDTESKDILLKHPERLSRAIGLRRDVVLRGRFCEDCLERAVARGANQFVIIGAGLETFAFRQPAWATTLAIWEIDHLQSHLDKRRRIEAAMLTVPPNLRLAAADIERVLVYLSETAIDSLFMGVAAMPSGSEIVFSFLSKLTGASTAKERRAHDEIAGKVSAWGERFLTFVEPAALASRLRSFGFSSVEFLEPAEAAALYFTSRTDALLPPPKAFLCRAVV